MRVMPCIVIPIYNHKDEIVSTVEQLLPHGYSLIVVDDGSDAATQAVLAQLEQRHRPQLRVLRRAENGGKGAAVMTGLRAARASGFTHTLQIDADGQHDAHDVPRFIEAAQRAPGAVVLGRPVYDESVPKSRLYGRYATHVWVWIETLSFEIRDSMCGFRVYPLEAVCTLLDEVRLGMRMDFDIEVLVRLHWRGLRFVSVPTRVVYAQDGLSHFDVLWDNVRISGCHTRLATGMVLRLPVLLGRKLLRRDSPKAPDGAVGAAGVGVVQDPTPDPTPDWAQDATAMVSESKTAPPAWWRMSERGSRLGMMLLALSLRVLGRRITSWWLHPIVFYFLLTGRMAREASYRYFARLGEAAGAAADLPRPGWCTAYRHMLAFAQSGLDKIAAWSGRLSTADLEFEDRGAFDALVASGRGALIVGAHLGNLEMTRALAVTSGRARITAIVYIEHARRFNSVLADANRDFGMQLVHVTDFGPQTAMMMQQRIEAGELLVIVGDRVPARDAAQSTRTTEAIFLGAPARFAQGPYVLAHSLGCPVYLFFCLKEAGRYHLYFEPFAERVLLPRGERAERLNAYAQRYAARLEHFCRKAPFQWFNFFDFWHRPGPDDEGVAHGRT
jgi:predicted LPLAT superfamily acyltransferase/GT2 family glycosyltransferase